MSDDEDLVLSQALDNLERSQMSTGEPEPKMPKLDFKRPKLLTLNLSRFKSIASKTLCKENSGPSSETSTSVANEPPVSNKSQTINQSIRNRMLCTPSDDESSQNEPSKRKISTKTLNLLNKFKFKENPNKNQPLQQQNAQQQYVGATEKSDGSQPENDSAYDTMTFHSSLPSTASPSCKKTRKTPSSSETENKVTEEDFSYLDTLELL